MPGKTPCPASLLLQNELAEQGVTDTAQLPGAHVISKAIGTDRYLKPEMHTYFRTPEDRFLFCTDGLSNVVKVHEIKNINNLKSGEYRELTIKEVKKLYEYKKQC